MYPYNLVHEEALARAGPAGEEHVPAGPHRLQHVPGGVRPADLWFQFSKNTRHKAVPALWNPRYRFQKLCSHPH